MGEIRGHLSLEDATRGVDVVVQEYEGVMLSAVYSGILRPELTELRS